MKRSPIRSMSAKRRSGERDKQRAVAAVKVRCAVLNAQKCEVCGQRQADDPAHRLASGRAGEWRASNLLALCRLCHDQQRDGKGGEALATRLGQVLPSMVDGQRPDPEAVPVQTVYGRVFLRDNGDVVPVGSVDAAIVEVL